MEIWKCIIFFAVFVLRQKRARVLHLEGNSFRVCTYAPRIYLNRPRNLSRSRINLWFQNFNAVSSLSHSLSLSSHYCCSGTARAVFTLFVARQSSECLQESEKVYIRISCMWWEQNSSKLRSIYTAGLLLYTASAYLCATP